MPNSEPGHEQPKITVLFGPFSANEVDISGIDIQPGLTTPYPTAAELTTKTIDGCTSARYTTTSTTTPPPAPAP